MTPEEFEGVLDEVVARLSLSAQKESAVGTSDQFEDDVLDVLRDVLKQRSERAEPSFHKHAFPDIRVNGFGVEVKITTRNSWQAVGNSVFEGMRDPTVNDVYVVFGKMAGWPEVRWAKYEDCVTHVRISHAPRFVLDMENPSRLFETMEISYSTFSKLPADEKMRHIRDYTRERLQPGERLWWLEDQQEPDQMFPLEIRLYTSLDIEEKDILRAEAALLCPSIVSPSRTKNKYRDAIIYLMTRHRVLCPQARDLYSAGSAAHRRSKRRGGKYVQRALDFIQPQMRDAALYLDDQLFVEYWGTSCPPDERIAEWLRRADELATDWIPSEYLFLDDDDE